MSIRIELCACAFSRDAPPAQPQGTGEAGPALQRAGRLAEGKGFLLDVLLRWPEAHRRLTGESGVRGWSCA